MMKNTGCIKRLLIWSMVAFSALFVQGAKMSPERVCQRSVEWAQRAFPSRQVLHHKMRTFAGAKNNGVFHVMPFKEGGFIVSHSDDASAPVAAFSLKGKFPEDPNHPLRQILAADAAAIAECGNNDEALALPSPVRLMSASYPTTTFEVWVKPILNTEWSQTTHNNGLQIGFGGTGMLCYNYYTPNWETKNVTNSNSEDAANLDSDIVISSHYPCGCTATAGAQVMKHFGYPKMLPELDRSDDGDGVEPYTDSEYLWDDMIFHPAEGISTKNCKAIGRICRDIGIACGANYGPQTRMDSFSLARAFKNTFSYKSAKIVNLEGDANKRDNAILPNIICGKPVILSISQPAPTSNDPNATEGHCVVVDGIGSDIFDNSEVIYYHINFGWANTKFKNEEPEESDYWYMPPNLRKYNLIKYAIVNIDPTQEKAYIGGRVIARNGGTPIRNANVQLSRGTTIIGTKQTNDHGLFSFMVDSGTYEIEITGTDDRTIRDTITIEPTLDKNVYSEYVLDMTATSIPQIESEQGNSGEMLITLSCAMPNAEIYYTIGDVKPDTSSTKYTKAFPVYGIGDVKVMAIAYADGYAASPTCTMTIHFSPTTNNGTFANARMLVGASGEVEMINQTAKRESGEPIHSPVGKTGGASVWASFTAPETGDYTFRASGSSGNDDESSQLDTQLAVYTGNSLSTLELIAANDDANAAEYNFSSRVAFHAIAGTTYRIAIDTHFGSIGTIKLEWQPCRDDIAEPEEYEVLAGPSGTSFSVPVHSTANWSVINSSPWIILDKASGSNGDCVEFSVPALPTDEKVRNGIVMLRAGDDGASSIIVSQATVEWVRSRADALSVATKSSKRIIMICGRDTCSNTSYLRNTVCEDSEVKALLASHFVLWYCNCDNDYDDYRYYSSGLGSYTLPLVCVINPETAEEYVERSTGFMNKSSFLSFLEQASEDQKPSKPYGFEVSVTAEGTMLIWNPSRRASYYEVWCGNTLIETTTGCSYTDSVLQSGALCTYRIRAVNAIGNSAFSEAIRVGWNEAANETSAQLGKALGAPHVVWQNGDDFPWIVQTDYTTDGSAVQSGLNDPNESVTSELSTEVNGPCFLSFRYMTRMYSSTFWVTLDGDTVFKDTQGESDWTRGEIRIPFGRHRVTFSYLKNGYYTSGFNGVYLDDIVFADERQLPPPDDPVVSEPVTPGVWTRDVEGAQIAGITNGNLIVVVLANYKGCSYSKAFHSVAWSADFLNWAKENGVYLIDADVSKNDDAYSFFWNLWSATPTLYPALAVTTAWAPQTPIDNVVARSGNTMGSVSYDGTALSLENYLSSLIQTRPNNRTVSITFYDYGNTYQRKTVSARSGQSFDAILEQKSKSGFVFDGWWTDYSGGTKITASSVVPYTDTTYYAHYHNIYSVAFDANGGQGARMSSLSLIGGTATILPLCTYSRVGFVFDGWAMRPDGASIYEDGASVKDLTSSGNGKVTLYAIWRPVASDGDWVTVLSPVNVPYRWLKKYSLLTQFDAETAAMSKTGKRNGEGRDMFVWEDFVMGTDPTNKNDLFRITDIRFENGEVVISWYPDLNENGTKSERLYIKNGRKSLESSENWVDMRTVPADKINEYKFIKVSVEMP